jgi:hypothetical protein
MAWKACAEKGQTVAAPPTATSQITCYAAPNKVCGSTQFIDKVAADVEASGSSGAGATDDGDGRLICAYHEQCPIGFAVFIAASATSQVICTVLDVLKCETMFF